uniref:EB domain-containing protein n=1 Tax=Trichuris muris TaxID=70415 RepID=A0A5S6R2K3_TRIMR
MGIKCKNDKDCGEKKKASSCWTEGETGKGKGGDTCKEQIEHSVMRISHSNNCAVAMFSMDKRLNDFMCVGYFGQFGFPGPPAFGDPSMFPGYFGSGYDAFGAYYGYPNYAYLPPHMMVYHPFYYGSSPGNTNVNDGTHQGKSGCSSHNDCEGPNLCISGQCQEMEPTNIKCQNDNDCPQGGCKANYCWQQPGSGGQVQPSQGQGTENEGAGIASGGPCTKQEDCNAVQMCGKDGKCVNGFSIEIECSSDSDCDEKQRCKGETCWTEGEPGHGKDGDYCTEHTECSVKSICAEKKCVPAIPSFDKCLIDLMCRGKGRVCKYFHCWKPLGSLGDLIG